MGGLIYTANALNLYLETKAASVEHTNIVTFILLFLSSLYNILCDILFRIKGSMFLTIFKGEIGFKHLFFVWFVRFRRVCMFFGLFSFSKAASYT